jgi:hypothetical protein
MTGPDDEGWVVDVVELVVVVVGLVVVVVLVLVVVVVDDVTHSIWYRSIPHLVTPSSETKLNAAVLWLYVLVHEYVAPLSPLISA